MKHYEEKHFDTLKDLFEYVLHQYENAETTCIGEFSSNMAFEYNELEKELASYQKEFNRLYQEELEKEEKDAFKL